MFNDIKKMITILPLKKEIELLITSINAKFPFYAPFLEVYEQSIFYHFENLFRINSLEEPDKRLR